MTEETENLVLELLRRTRASQERMEADISDMKPRLSAVEIQLAALNSRVDRFDERLARIERRLDLVEAEHRIAVTIEVEGSTLPRELNGAMP